MAPMESVKKKEAFIAIMAHNEEGNIAALLERVVSEQVPGIRIPRIIVVSSGSTDRTDEIVRTIAKEEPRVTLITQEKRHGKCAAINLFLEECPPGCLVMLLSGDVLPETGALSRLLLPLLEPETGMTGGRPVPVNDPGRFFGFAAHLIWKIHHQVALDHPKLGEAVAFRKIMDTIPEDLAVDEAAIEAIIRKAGLHLRYCPDAIIRNRGPDNLGDFLKQRRRIQTGHLHLHQKMKYKVSTYGFLSGLKALYASMDRRPKTILWTAATCLLVLLGRLLGSLDYRLPGRRHAVWEIAESTKGKLSDGPSKG